MHYLQFKLTKKNEYCKKYFCFYENNYYEIKLYSECFDERWGSTGQVATCTYGLRQKKRVKRNS